MVPSLTQIHTPRIADTRLDVLISQGCDETMQCHLRRDVPVDDLVMFRTT